MNKESVTGIGGIITAVMASLCCVGPIVFAFVGVGSIGVFSVFEAYRPYLISATVALLGIAFYFTYKKREVHCEDGSCKIESAGKMNKFSVWFAAVIAVIALAFPYAGTVQSSPTTNDINSTTIAYLNVEGMDCESCARGVEGSLESIQGVQSAIINYAQKKASIEYDSTIVSADVFLQRIIDNGLKGSVIAIKSKKGS